MPSSVLKPALHPPGRRLVWRLAISAGLILPVIAAAGGGCRSNHESNRSDQAIVRFAAGQRLVYQIDFDSASVSNFGAVFAEGRSLLSHVFEATLQGELMITVLEADDQHVSLAYDFRHLQVRFETEGQDDPNQSQSIQTSLAQPVFCLLDGRDRVQSLRFDSAASPVAQQMTRTLLAAMQIVRPELNADSTMPWEAEEEDPSGRLIAHYQVQPDGTVHKAKLRYLQPKPIKKTKTVELTPTIQSEGEYVATLDAAGNLSALSVAEAQSMTLQNKVIGQGILKLDTRLMRKEESTPNELALLRTASAERAKTARAVSLYDPTPPAEAELAIQREALGGATLESLLDDLAAAEAQSLQQKDITQLCLKFKALAFVRPEACAALGDLLTRAEAGSLRMRVLADTLESAGNVKAQAALSDAVRGRARDWPALQFLIPALGAAESPTSQTVDTLLAFAFGQYDKNVTTTARLALGNVARSLNDESPAKASRIVDRLVQELADPASADSRWELLLALGNAGSIEAIPTLRHYMDDPAPNLRGAAAWALRWIDSPEVDLLLTTKALGDDQDPGVRTEAVRALRFREKTPANIAAEENALAKEAEPDVRIELLSNLWDVRESNPQAKLLVEKAATDDPSPAVRDVAAKILEKAQTP
jgi:hypothetical protein